MERVLVTIVAAATFACGDGRLADQTSSPQKSVTVYVSTDRVFSEPILKAFERRHGIRVNAVYDTEETKSTGLANRLLAERERAQADVFWSNEPVQRVALARALVSNPDLLLLDEPLSSLDEDRRASLRKELASIPRTLGVSMIYVTHDRADAEAFGGEVLVLAPTLL